MNPETETKRALERFSTLARESGNPEFAMRLALDETIRRERSAAQLLVLEMLQDCTCYGRSTTCRRYSCRELRELAQRVRRGADPPSWKKNPEGQGKPDRCRPSGTLATGRHG